MGKCPGMDPSNWKAKDIAEHPCACGTLIEFWKDDVKRVCPNCQRVNFNPNLGNVCLSWCARAVECLGNQDIEEWKQKTATERAAAAACNPALETKAVPRGVAESAEKE